MRTFAVSMVCVLLLLFCRPGWTFTVRRMGCMMETGSENIVVKHLQRQEDIQPPDKPDSNNKEGQQQQQKTAGLFNLAADDADGMTVQGCVQQCWKMRFTFAALQDGRRCLCSNFKDDLNPVDPSFCHERCSGNCKQICGGRVALSVFNTGYEKGPLLKPVDLYRGLLGCYPSSSLLDWCGPSRSPVPSFSRQHLRPHLGGGRERAADEGPKGRLAGKPPLVTQRMSALLCVTYCVSQPASTPIAVLQTSDSCCCGVDVGMTPESLLKEKERKERLEKLSKNCNEPCADPVSRPLCVGWVGDQRFVSVYNTFAIWPVLSERPGAWTRNFEWLQPAFPPNDSFEVSSHRTQEQWSQRQGELSGVNLENPAFMKAAPPEEDAPNESPWVLVMDDVDDGADDTRLVWFLAAIIFMCLLLFLAMLSIIISLKKKNKDEPSAPTREQGRPADQEKAELLDQTPSSPARSEQGETRSNNNTICLENHAAINSCFNCMRNEANWSDNEAVDDESETEQFLYVEGTDTIEHFSR